MTRLEEEISYNISVKWLFGEDGAGKMSGADLEIITKAAVEVAKRYIEKAMWDFYTRKNSDSVALVGEALNQYLMKKEKWLKENGVI